MPDRRDSQAGGKSGAKSPFGTALTIEELHDDANLAPEEFEARYGNGFLLVTAAGLESQKGTTTQLLLDGIDEDPGEHTAGLAVLVYPLRQRDILGGHLVTLGREATHDIVIPDPSISRFHAFIKQGAEGEFLLQDAGSTNGTLVNGASVPTRGSGPPTRLKPGDTVRLGQLESTFTDATALRHFVLQTGG
jgi:pSer/pThr/pTyr-binding forkhead associated (FHA) protein